MKRTTLALLAAIAAATAPVVAGEAWAQGKYVHANNSGYDNLDPHAIFDVGRAASRELRFEPVPDPPELFHSGPHPTYPGGLSGRVGRRRSRWLAQAGGEPNYGALFAEG